MISSLDVSSDCPNKVKASEKLSKKKFKNTGSVEVVKNILYLVNKNEA